MGGEVATLAMIHEPSAFTIPAYAAEESVGAAGRWIKKVEVVLRVRGMLKRLRPKGAAAVEEDAAGAAAERVAARSKGMTACTAVCWISLHLRSTNQLQRVLPMASVVDRWHGSAGQRI